MRPLQKIAFVVVVVCQLLTLGGMIAKQERLLQTGAVVLLECQPVDPRSLFSGDYVILNYTISTFSEEEFQRLNRDDEYFQERETIYVALEKSQSSKFWDAVAVSHDLNKLKVQYPVVIRGVIKSTWNHRIRYGVEHYFVPQSEGLRIENEISNVSVEVAVSDSGESGIKRLFIKDREVAFY